MGALPPNPYQGNDSPGPHFCGRYLTWQWTNRPHWQYEAASSHGFRARRLKAAGPDAKRIRGNRSDKATRKASFPLAFRSISLRPKAPNFAIPTQQAEILGIFLLHRSPSTGPGGLSPWRGGTGGRGGPLPRLPQPQSAQVPFLETLLVSADFTADQLPTTGGYRRFIQTY